MSMTRVSPRRHWFSAVLSAAILGWACLAMPRPAQAKDPAPLVMVLGGLKHQYKVVFKEFDEANQFARGHLEIYSEDDTETPELKVPFAAELKPDAKDKKTELLSIRCTAMLSFFPPADRKEPYPTLTWKLTGRKAGKAKLKASLWDYNAEKATWALTELELEREGK